jgi:carbonic anhydrase/acetyltransferase-like protein (isoleucine patch superfamily)
MPISNYLNTSPTIGDRVFLHPSCQVIGDVTLGDDSSVWCNTVLRGDVNRIVIGRGTNIQDLTMGHVSHKTSAKPRTIGDRPRYFVVRFPQSFIEETP